jgi:hypothetical protein
VARYIGNEFDRRLSQLEEDTVARDMDSEVDGRLNQLEQDTVTGDPGDEVDGRLNQLEHDTVTGDTDDEIDGWLNQLELVEVSSLPCDDRTCSICLSSYEDTGSPDPPARMGSTQTNRSCGHVFHRSCLKEWFTSEMRNCGKCPMCRHTWFLYPRGDFEDWDSDSDYDSDDDSDYDSDDDSDDNLEAARPAVSPEGSRQTFQHASGSNLSAPTTLPQVPQAD